MDLCFDGVIHNHLAVDGLWKARNAKLASTVENLVEFHIPVRSWRTLSSLVILSELRNLMVPSLIFNCVDLSL